MQKENNDFTNHFQTESANTTLNYLTWYIFLNLIQNHNYLQKKCAFVLIFVQ